MVAIALIPPEAIFSKQESQTEMPITSRIALDVLRKLEFHLYHAKSTNESLLIHSFSVYALLDKALKFNRFYTEAEKELMRWAALLHDYGKTAAVWQRAKRGPHRVTLGDTKYEELRQLLENGIEQYSVGLLSPADVPDILFIIEFHHGSGRSGSTPSRSRMKDVVSDCDRAVSQSRVSEDLIRTLNTVIDTIRYRLFTIELIEHPISPLVIGAFDYVLEDTGKFWPLLYSPTSTLYAAEQDAQVPGIDEVNSFLNDQIGPSQGVLRYDGSNTRIFTNERSFLELAYDPDRFVKEATLLANAYCERMRKRMWSTEDEEVYLYGRVCGITYNTILDLCGASAKEFTKACLMAGGRHGPVTVQSLDLLGLRKPQSSYDQTLRSILEKLKPMVQKRLQTSNKEAREDAAGPDYRYDVRDLLVPDSSVYSISQPIDPRAEALVDYERYWNKDPLQVCPTCNHFRQENVSAASFPRPSPLGGTVEVFYTSYMRLVKKEGTNSRGVSFCDWCAKWWDLISTDSSGQRTLYHCCVMPHHLFARLDWRELLQPDDTGKLVELGSPGTVGSSGAAYPHLAMLRLGGRDRESLLGELAAAPHRAQNQILDRLYHYGLRAITVTTNPVSSRYLLTCGSIRIDAAEWPLLRIPLRLLDSKRRPYARAIRALQQSPFAFGTLLADGSIPITRGLEKEIKEMVTENAARAGLSFLSDIWIGGKDRLDGASKVIRGMNETLRRLKGKEDDASLIDAMEAKGIHLAVSTREGIFRSKENLPKERSALRQAAEKLLAYKDQTYRRTELVRAMIYTLTYFSKPEEKPEESPAGSPQATASQTGGE